MQDDRVIFVERHQRHSLAFPLLAACTLAISLQIPFEPPKPRDQSSRLDRRGRRSDEPFPARPAVMVCGAGFLFVAVYYLFNNRAFILHGPSSSMIVLERQLFSSSTQREYPRNLIEARMQTIILKGLFGERTVYWIWLEIRGCGSILFENDIRDQWRARDQVAQLNADLRAPSASQLPTE